MREDWEKITMLEACDLITCGVAARPKYVDEGIPFLSAKNVKEGQIIYENYNCITEKNHQELTKKNKPLVGDLLYTRVGSYGEAAVIEENIEFSVFVSLTLIKPKKELLSSYFLRYYLNSHEVKTLAKNSITSSGVGNLNVGTVRKFPVPIPPLPEQKQIVALLDEAFAAIDQAKANIEKNIENAKELFQSKLNDIFSQKGDGWEEKTLGEVCENLDSKRIPITKSKRESGKIPYYGASGIVDYVADYIFDEDLLLVSEDGANLLARTYPIAFSISGKTWVNNHAHALKFQNMTSQVFIEYYLNSIRLDDYISGMAQPKLNQRMLNSILVPFPSFEIQENVVSIVENLSNEIKNIITQYEQKHINLEELKKSILQKAFAGELTENAVVA